MLGVPATVSETLYPVQIFARLGSKSFRTFPDTHCRCAFPGADQRSFTHAKALVGALRTRRAPRIYRRGADAAATAGARRADVRRPARAGISGPPPDLPPAVGQRAALRRWPATSRRAAGRARGRDAAQHPAVRGVFFRRGALGRGGGQYLTALDAPGTSAATQRLRRGRAGDARQLLPALRRDRAPSGHRSAPGGRHRDSGRPAVSQEPALPAARKAEGDLGGREGERQGGGLRAPLRAPLGGPHAGQAPARRRGAASVHRRHHRAAQGRDADPPQPGRQRPAGRWLDAGSAARPGSDLGGHSVFPRLRHDRRHEPEPLDRGQHRPDSQPARPQGPAERHREERRDPLSRRADLIQRHQQFAADPRLRPQDGAGLHLRQRAAARRDGPEVS